MSPMNTETATTTESFPRVSGDEPWAQFVEYCRQEFSPRERG